MSYPRFLLSRAHKFARRTSGNVVLTSTAWANVDTALDMILDAQVGDVLGYELNAALGTEAQDAYFDAVTLNPVGGAPLNSFANAGAVEATPTAIFGVAAWVARASVPAFPAGVARYAVQAADLSVTGLVTVRLRAAIYTSGSGSRSLFAASFPLVVAVANLGPVDPN